MTALDFFHDFLSSFGISLTTLLAVLFGIAIVSFFVLREVFSWFVRTSHIREELADIKEEIAQLKIDLAQDIKLGNEKLLQALQQPKPETTAPALEKAFSLKNRPVDFKEKTQFPLE